MKPKMLDPWTAGRVQQPERAYKKFFFLEQEPIRYTRAMPGNFGKAPDHLLPPSFKEYL